MKSKLAELFNKLKTGKNKTFVLVFFLIGLALIIFETSGEREEFWPGENRISQELRDLKQQQLKLQKELNEAAALKYRRDAFTIQHRDYWISPRDGKAETEVQKIINHAAKVSGMKLTSIGDLRPIKITEDIFTMEMSIAGIDNVENVMRFSAELYRSNPKFYWQRCQIRPDNTKKSKNISLNANLRFLCINDKKTVDFLIGNKK